MRLRSQPQKLLNLLQPIGWLQRIQNQNCIFPKLCSQPCKRSTDILGRMHFSGISGLVKIDITYLTYNSILTDWAESCGNKKSNNEFISKHIGGSLVAFIYWYTVFKISFVWSKCNNGTDCIENKNCVYCTNWIKNVECIYCAFEPTLWTDQLSNNSSANFGQNSWSVAPV